MSATIYWVQNAAFQTAAAPVKVATGTSIKTLLQVATPATVTARIVEWGISFDAPASASIVAVELFQANAAGTGGTSITPQAYSDPNAVASLCVGGTAATCFSPATVSPTGTVRNFDLQLITPPAQYVKQWPLGREPVLPISNFLQVRVTASVTCNTLCYVIWEE